MAGAFISGVPGTGKTSIAYILANKLNGSLCKKFNPTNPNYTLDILYTVTNPTKKNPLILILDEIDILIDMIHIGIPNSKKFPIEVKNKTEWSILMDDINSGLYPHMIVVMTSNKPIEYFDELDPAYMREGRVDYKAFIKKLN